MATKIVGNLRELIQDSAAGYIANNSEAFRSNVPGPKGDDGVAGPQGQGVHHLKGTSTTQSEGDFGHAGELDTYTFYADAGETLPLSWFVVRNGKDAYQYALENGYTGTENEFNSLMAGLAGYTARAEAAADSAEADAIRTAADRIVTTADRAVVELARDDAVNAASEAVTANNQVQMIFLGNKPADPSSDNHGGPLVKGMMYFNTVTNMLKIWTGTAWATGAFAAEGAVISFNGRDGAVSLTVGDVNIALGRNINSVVDAKADSDNSVLTGVPVAPTATIGTNSTQIATTAYVMNEINKIEEW